MKKHTSNPPIGTTLRVETPGQDFLEKYKCKLTKEGYLHAPSGHVFSGRMFKNEYIVHRLPEKGQSQIGLIPTIIVQILNTCEKEGIGMESHIPEPLIKETGRILDISKFPHKGSTLITKMCTREAGIHISGRCRKNTSIGSEPIEFLELLRKYVPSTSCVSSKGDQKDNLAAYIEALLMCSYKPRVLKKHGGLLIATPAQPSCCNCGWYLSTSEAAAKIEQQKSINAANKDIPILSFRCMGCGDIIALKKSEGSFGATLIMLKTGRELYTKYVAKAVEAEDVEEDDYFWDEEDDWDDDYDGE